MATKRAASGRSRAGEASKKTGSRRASKSTRSSAGEAEDDSAGTRGKVYCTTRKPAPRTFAPSVSGERLGALVMNQDKWVNGTVLEYAFFPNTGSFKAWAGTDALKAQVRKAMQAWTSLGIGLKFEEVSDRAQAKLRIGFMAGDGHWSYVGREVLKQGVDDRTLNLDPEDGIASGKYGIDVAIHELGHSMGFPHEHQNPNAGIVWNEEAVYAALGAPPNNWDRETTFYNIIRKIPADEVQGSAWDPDSVMHYPFEAGLIKEPAQYRAGLQPAGGISKRDVEWVKKFYPPLGKKDEQELPLLETARLSIGPGEQKNFILKPKVSRKYQIATFGTSDTVGVLNVRNANGSESYLAGDDDSGQDRNMHIERRLLAGNTYVLRLRLYYASDSAHTAVMWW
ncbi:MAG: M12 family metallopeptidase [Myxococcota bacterium]